VSQPVVYFDDQISTGASTFPV